MVNAGSTFRIVLAIVQPRWRWLLAVAILSTAQIVLASEAGASKEYQVKAAFLYNFTKFVEWEPTRFLTPDSPIVIGVVGKNPFGDELEKMVQTRKVNGRGFAVKVVTSAAELGSIHVLFVPSGEENRLASKPEDPLYAPGMLTVGESDQFADFGGIINFVTDIDKVRFQINREAANRVGVKISAQLLKLAVPRRKRE